MAEGFKDEPAMDAKRFAALAAAYGGYVRRWPEAERMDGTVFAASEAGQAILKHAGALDALLDSYRVDAHDSALHGRILQTAGPHLAQRRRQRFWWLGLGLAGIGLAGAVVGLALVSVITPETGPDQYVLDANATAFGDAGPDAENSEESL